MLTPPTLKGMHKTPATLTGLALLFVALIFALLQCRCPHFNLMDDNLTTGYPFFCEVGRHLLHGEWPWYSGYIFGGHYDMARDLQYFSWHPLYLLTSLLSETPFHLWIIDVDAFVLYLIAAAGFVRLAINLREEGLTEASDGWILFCTLSFTFTMMALTTCASWLTFENNAGALPWLALGILHKQWRWGLALITVVSAHQILGGHPEPLVSNTFFLSLFAVGIAWWRRSWQPLLCWGFGFALALILVSPLLVPVVEGFFSSNRAGGVPVSDMQENNIPAIYFACSFFLGTGLALMHAAPAGMENGTYVFALGNCAAAWCLLPAVLSHARWRFLELLSLGLFSFAVVLVCRPLWISEVLVHLPLLRAMRWPFRELVQLQFFFHLFLVLRPMTWQPRVLFLTAATGAVAFVVPMLLNRVTPTFNNMPLDRKIILSGELEPYWAKVRPYFKPGDRFVVLLPFFPTQTDSMRLPFSYLGGFNYPMLTLVTCGSGYSQTIPSDQFYIQGPMLTHWGAYHIKQREELLRQHPDLKFITLEQVHPLKITLSSNDGPTIDLTPFIPPDILEQSARADALLSR